MANVVGPRTYRAWGALENGLAEYHALLRRRRDALEGARRLAEQNAELRALLNQYLSSKINDELQVPPTAIIEARGRGRRCLVRFSITRGRTNHASLLSKRRLVDASMRHIS